MTPAVRAAALGAAAGLAGALAMLVAGTLEDRKTVRHNAGANLTYAAVLGAAYGLLRSRIPRRPAARAALVSALSYAMHLPHRREPGAPAELSPVFGLATAAAFDALAGR